MRLLDWRPYPELKTAIVNLKSGTSFRGVVWRVKRPYLVIRNVEMLNRANKNMTVLDGEVVVLLEQVDFIQVV